MTLTLPLTCFVAFCESDFSKLNVQDSGDGIVTIAPDLFEGGFIPLKLSADRAMECALQVRFIPAIMAAIAPTDWRILQVTFRNEQLTAMFLSQALTHARDRHGPGVFHLHEPLCTRDAASFSWHQTTIMPQGLELWAQFSLRMCFFVFQECRGCHTLTLCGAPKSKFGSVPAAPAYCLRCWHEFRVSNAPEDMHTRRDLHTT
jgi:hypothetical protein